MHGQTILAGISGGPDSLCLLDGLHHLGFHVIAACYNHGLRPEAADEMHQVENLADQMRIPFVSGEGDVAAEAQHRGESIEATARQMRYAFLFSSARQYHAAAVAVGHNADDQVETVLMHMLRGSGLNGLRGMAYRTLTAWDDGIPLVRPLLKCWRNEILEYCRQAGLQPSLDQSNLEPIYFRNRIRLELLPGLESLSPGARERIWNLSQLAGDDLDLLADLEQQAWMKCMRANALDHVAFRLAELQSQPDAMIRRLIRRAAALLRPTGEGLNLENTLRAAGLVQSPNRGQTIELADRLILRIDGEDLILADRGYAQVDSNYPQMNCESQVALALNASIDLGCGWLLSIEESAPPERGAIKQGDGLHLDAWLDADTVHHSLIVRPARSGDRYQPLGMTVGSQKLSDFWINRHVPAAARKHWPLVVCGDEIVWVPGFAPAQRVRLQPTTSRCLHLAISRD